MSVAAGEVVVLEQGFDEYVKTEPVHRPKPGWTFRDGEIVDVPLQSFDALRLPTRCGRSGIAYHRCEWLDKWLGCDCQECA